MCLVSITLARSVWAGPREEGGGGKDSNRWRVGWHGTARLWKKRERERREGEAREKGEERRIVACFKINAMLKKKKKETRQETREKYKRAVSVLGRIIIDYAFLFWIIKMVLSHRLGGIGNGGRGLVCGGGE